MKFFNREKEIKYLLEIEKKAKKNSQMTVMVGRRRVGKTMLIKKSYSSKNFLYFFISRKNEALLCEEFSKIITDTLDVKMFGEIKKFSELFEFILNLSQNNSFTICIDEFQEFMNINQAVYSEMQNIWDSYKEKAKINLILCGSIYSLMNKIFENYKEPLFGRATNKIILKPFSVGTIKEIFKTYHPNYANIDLLAFYILTGGVAKYVEYFVDNNTFTLADMVNIIFDENSIFIDEGKAVLIEEFGKEYATYFSILSLISSSKTSRSEIESILEKSLGGYLDRLCNDYSIIKKVRPFNAKEGTRTIKYYIEDNFLNFWFRFIYKYNSAIEIENYENVKDIVLRDFNSYAGRFLEKYFIEKLKKSKKYTEIGSYWETGNQNEIDIIAVNESAKEILFVEVKFDKARGSINKLIEKSKNFMSKRKRYSAEYKIFSLEDM